MAEIRAMPRLTLAAAVAFAIAMVLNTLGVFTEEVIHWTNWLIDFLIAGVATAIVFGWFVRRAARDDKKSWRTGLVFGVLAVLTTPAFWSSLPPIFAVAAMYLGYRAYRTPGSTARRAGLAAFILGVLGLLIDVAFYASDIATRV